MIRFALHLLDRLRHRARLNGNSSQAVGWRGEDLAHRFLQQQGYVVVARNYRPYGGSAEADLVAYSGETLVLIEVKTRSTDEFGSPDRAVGIEKQRNMVRAGLEFARRAGIDLHLLRFDIVNVVLTNPPSISHLKDVLPLRQLHSPDA